MAQGMCSVDGCESPTDSRGLCNKHYLRLWSKGLLEPLPRKIPARETPCSVEGCDRMCVARGYCQKHWARWKQHGDPLVGGRTTTCTIEGCGLPHCARGWCRRHYETWKIHGDPLYERVLPTEAERFWSKVDKNGPVPDYRPDLGQCWVWTRTMFRAGYGCFSADGKSRSAHKWAYEHTIGPVPDGLVLDHLCRVRHCVRPSHLEPVTPGTNVLRGETIVAAAAAKTECVHGHEYDLVNTGYERDGRRYCRECKRAQGRKAWARKRSAA